MEKSKPSFGRYDIVSKITELGLPEELDSIESFGYGYKSSESKHKENYEDKSEGEEIDMLICTEEVHIYESDEPIDGEIERQSMDELVDWTLDIDTN